MTASNDHESEIDTPRLNEDEQHGLSDWFCKELHVSDGRGERALENCCRATWAIRWINRVRDTMLDFHKSQFDRVDRPKTLAELADRLGRDKGTVSRWLNPEHPERALLPDPLRRHRIAIWLGCRDEDLSPDIETWLASTVALLFRVFQQQELDEPVGGKHIERYAKCMILLRLDCAETTDDINSKVVRQIACDEADIKDVRRAIVSVARKVGSVLRSLENDSHLTVGTPSNR